MKKGHTTPRVTFIAARNLVRDALIAGWSAKAIYEQNSELRGGISYRQFVRYVNEMRAAEASQQPASAQTNTNDPTTKGPASVRKAFAGHTGIADAATIRKLTHG